MVRLQHTKATQNVAAKQTLSKCGQPYFSKAQNVHSERLVSLQQDSVGALWGAGGVIKSTKQTVAVVATLGQVRQSSDYRSAYGRRRGPLCRRRPCCPCRAVVIAKHVALHFLKHIKLF